LDAKSIATGRGGEGFICALEVAGIALQVNAKRKEAKLDLLMVPERQTDSNIALLIKG
jgi:hypothetical protein